jgi:ubiquinone/menaquinone biosynthesis C-methylase UbiE
MSYSAESYERYIVPGLFARWATSLVQRANPQPGERVLDVACGTGIVARKAAPHVGLQGTVVGLDVNPHVINTARLAAERENLAIEWHAGPAEQLPFPEESFDLIFCQFGLMFFTDRHAALKEMQRVLRPGGRLVLSVWQGLDRHPFHQTLDEVSKRRLGKSSVQSVFSLGDGDELHELLADAGFQQIEIEPESITARFAQPEEFLAWEIGVDPSEMTALQNLEAGAQKASLPAVRQDMQKSLDAVMQAGQAVLQYHAYVAAAVAVAVAGAAAGALR